MKIEIIFFIVLTIIIAYIFILYKVEKMAGDTPSTVDQIKDAIKQIYLADVEAIRNLSAVATKLQADGLTIPGQLKVGGKLATNNLDPANMPDGWGGGLRIFDGYSSGTMGFGPDGKKLNAYINAAGDMLGNNLTLNNNLNVKVISAQDNINVSNKSNEGGRLRILNELKNGKANQTNDWSIWNMTGDYGNKLSFWRYNGDGKNIGSALDLYDNGTVNIPGKLQVNDVFSTKNKARFIRVGNTDPLIGPVQYWTLIELRVFDHTGANVALNKSVSILQGSALDSRFVANNITNGKIFDNPAGPSENMLLGYHGCKDGINQLEIDLGAEMDIFQIQLINRWHGGVSERMNGTIVELLDAQKNKIRSINTGIWLSIYSKEYIL